MWGTQNFSSINHGGEILCAFICVFYTKSLLPREEKFCVPVSNHMLGSGGKFFVKTFVLLATRSV